MSAKRIEDYALIGDGETAALVHREGTIEWLCFPRFDAEACCAALLGDQENGCWHIAPDAEILSVERRYRGENLILETEFTCAHGKLRLTDFMPIRGEAPDVVRMIECLEGELEVTGELFLRFDYGRIHPLARQLSETRALAISGPDGIILDFDDPIAFVDRRFVTRSSLRAGDRRCFVLTWYPSHEEPPRRVDPQAALSDTEAYWRGWLAETRYDGRYREQVVRSLITLKAMIYRPTGGIVAAPTAGLPERLGGDRNWDYRFCWLRDAAFTLLALLNTGLTAEAAAWIGWLRRAVGGDPIDLRPFYSVTGQPRAIEWEADWLPGFAGSTPVRFGNDAQGQLQLDVYGEVIDCLYQACSHGLADGDDGDQLMRLIAAQLAQVWREPDAGLWESRGAPRQHTYSKVMCWVAFDRAAAWFEGNDDELHRRYTALADEARAMVLERGWNAQGGYFQRAFDDPALDAGLLRMPMVGFLSCDDERMAATVAAIENRLCEGGLVRRYDPEETSDGVGGGEGAFTAACFWLVDAMCLQGREDEARALFEQLLARANDLGLLSEQLEIGGDRQLGNFPQALSHLSLIRSAYRLDQGAGMDRSPCSKGGT